MPEPIVPSAEESIVVPPSADNGNIPVDAPDDGGNGVPPITPNPADVTPPAQTSTPSAGIVFKIIAGKTLPIDDEFKFEQAQNDVKEGFIAPPDYLEIAKYDNAKELAKNAVLYKQNPMAVVNINPGDMPLPFTPGTPTLPQFGKVAEPPANLPTA